MSELTRDLAEFAKETNLSVISDNVVEEAKKFY